MGCNTSHLFMIFLILSIPFAFQHSSLEKSKKVVLPRIQRKALFPAQHILAVVLSGTRAAVDTTVWAVGTIN